MAAENPTGDGTVVALTIPFADHPFLRDLFTKVRDGLLEELTDFSGQLREPLSKLQREALSYERLRLAIDSGSIVNDHQLRGDLRALAESVDHENRYAEVVAEHVALCRLVDQLQRAAN
jgi:hypothetical protein